MADKVKVLYFVDRMLKGGIQALVVDWVSGFDKEKIQVDFLLLDDGKHYELEDTLKELGCNVFKLNGIWIKTPFDFISQDNALRKFYNNHNDYKVIHFHSSSKNYLVLKYAKKYKIPIRIVHSHSTRFQGKNIIKKFFGNILKPMLVKYATDYFACSEVAGRWLFGKKIVNSNKFKIICNAIDYNKFKFNGTYCVEKRKEFGFNKDNIVIGNVGRFSKVKNHKFIIDIFKECYKINNKYRLLLIGTGELEEKIKDKVEKLGLSNYVVFAGFRNDVNECIQAMNCFLMPSLYEGLPVAGIEAQASGLQCFFSYKVITEEVKITDGVNFISLDNNAKEWANIITNCNLTRKDYSKEIKDNGYFLDDTIIELENFYEKD